MSPNALVTSNVDMLRRRLLRFGSTWRSKFTVAKRDIARRWMIAAPSGNDEARPDKPQPSQLTQISVLNIHRNWFGSRLAELSKHCVGKDYAGRQESER